MATATMFVELLRPRTDSEWLSHFSGTRTILRKRYRWDIRGMHAHSTASLRIVFDNCYDTSRFLVCYLQQ